MPVSFSVDQNEGYFTSHYTGTIHDPDLHLAWKQFLDGDQWVPGLNELADLSESDLSKVSTGAIKQLALYVKHTYESRGIKTRVAIYAPADLPFGLARVYDTWATDSPETIRVFRDREKAVEWLRVGA